MTYNRYPLQEFILTFSPNILLVQESCKKRWKAFIKCMKRCCKPGEWEKNLKPSGRDNQSLPFCSFSPFPALSNPQPDLEKPFLLLLLQICPFIHHSWVFAQEWKWLGKLKSTVGPWLKYQQLPAYIGINSAQRSRAEETCSFVPFLLPILLF